MKIIVLHSFVFFLVYMVGAQQLDGCFTGQCYYVDASQGADANDGLSPGSAFQSLERVSALELQAGDSILLTSGQTFKGVLKIKNKSGTASRPIVVMSSGETKAIIDGKGFGAAVAILNSSFVTVKNLELTADGGRPVKDADFEKKHRAGLFFMADDGGTYSDLVFEDLYIHDVYYNDKGYTRPNQGRGVLKEHGHDMYGWGARLVCSKNSGLSNVTVKRCRVERTSHTGIRFFHRDLTGSVPFVKNINILDCHVCNTGGPGITVLVADQVLIRGCHTQNTGIANDARHRGQGTGIWGFNMHNAVIEKNTVTGARGGRDAAGIHIDSYSSNVLVQYNLSRQNAGAFVHICGSVSNSTYRYNLSINDGYRRRGVKGGRVDGFIFRLFGYVLPGVEFKGPDNVYIYNNTIYTGETFKDNVFLIEKTVKGALFANNVVYTVGSIVHNRERSDDAVLGDAQKNNLVFFKNNLFRREFAWMSDPFTVTGTVVADPAFVRAGGDSIEDYIPKNRQACSQGIQIEKLPGDTEGPVGGFDVEYDILGRKIDPSKSFIGAIRPN
ncbi:right-handed parallel beta-helix repeat-containing protein [Pontiella sulfatireligans]|uniref:Right handed beta helix domain-containing protein n=1 Tax=Pontiella sulfatireligans TaxID=2750658 RepID=A0A6C2UU57_9BACT|nr:right-handed parallel beta-helix repeat-containing protein [Pontiella sulfatireligans]VGO22687.1 hypothetical protein SCARR_04782 [Pontiella sulfatireligans]